MTQGWQLNLLFALCPIIGNPMFITILRRFCSSIDYVVLQIGKAAAYVMPVLACIVGFEVFSRYFLGNPTIWAYDLSLFMFGYIAALGGALAQQKRAHISVDILYAKVTAKTKCIFNLFSFSLGIFFLVIMVKLGVEKLLEAWEFDYRRQSEWAPPMHHFWVMIIVASVLFIVQLVRDILADLYYLLTGKLLIKTPELPEDTELTNTTGGSTGGN
jgi:TRAP-type C4-dicarboxylate transport system permease small subunit